MHTLRQNYSNVLICKLLHVSGLTGPSTGSSQLSNTVVQHFFYHPRYVELSQVRHYMIIQMDMCTVIGAACVLMCSQYTFVQTETSFTHTPCCWQYKKKHFSHQNVKKEGPSSEIRNKQLNVKHNFVILVYSYSYNFPPNGVIIMLAFKTL